MPIVLTRATKLEARYKALGGREHCSACRFYMPQGTCGRIIGPVSPEGWCKYYSREMVQRWQPGSAGGNAALPPGVSLDLSFMSPGTLDPRITFTRASTGTYFDSTGTIQTAAINAPRWDYANGVLRGLLIEEARTNIWLQSADASNAAWGTLGSAPPVGPTVTGNNTIAPDGTPTAARVVYPAVSVASSYSVLYQGLTTTANPYTFSVWLKGSAGGEQIYLSLLSGPAPRLTLTTQWQRFTLNVTTAAGTTYFMIGTDLRGGQASTPAQTVYVWGAQVEQGAFPTSYIPTTAAAVTRALDDCTIQFANMGWFVSPGGSWFAEFISLNQQVVAAYRRIIAHPTPGNVTPLTLGINSEIGQYDGTVGMFTANTIIAGAVNKGAATWVSGPIARACLNGGAIASAVNLTAGYVTLGPNGVRFLANATPGDAMSGYIRRVSYWPRVLSDAEMQQVTT